MINSRQNAPALYISTCRKYASGSIDGNWLSLCDYASYNDFLTACNNLHSDESEPEILILDTSNLPDGLDCIDTISESEFNDIISEYKANNLDLRFIDYSDRSFAVVGNTQPLKDDLKRLGGKFNARLSCGCGWIFQKSKLGDLSDFLKLDNITLEPNEKSDTTAKESDYKAILSELANNNKYIKEYSKNFIGAVKIDINEYFVIDKGHIENNFYFHDEGPGYEEYKRVTADEQSKKDYFINENLSEFDDLLNELREGSKMYYGKDTAAVEYDYHERIIFKPYSVAYTPIPEEYRTDIIKFVEYAKEQKEKRLNTYLKKYGVSKLSFNTYWADR